MRVITLILLTASLALLSCEEDPIVPESLSSNTLRSYLNQFSAEQQSNQLIACAAGGKIIEARNEDAPIAIFLLPIEGATDFRYFETDSIEVHPDSLQFYREKSLSLEPVWNGFLLKFNRTELNAERWCKVTFIAGDSVHMCNAIRLKYSETLTQSPGDLLEIDLQDALRPAFSWTNDSTEENAIYFQVISNQQNNLLTGTYTFTRTFQFYNLSNVVLNINPIWKDPSLLPDKKYHFTLMGVSEDNWVHTMVTEEFITE